MYVLLEGKAAVRKKTSVPAHVNVIACSCRRNIAGYAYCDRRKHEIHPNRTFKNLLPTWQKARCLSIAKTNRLMVFVELIFALYENHATYKHAVQSGYIFFKF
jgi:hypothetical protein